MKKLTNFIVDKKLFILVSIIILSFISLFISSKVNINNDIAKYLPKTSETRIGMDIMDENFDEIKESQLIVMFSDLSKDEKLTIKKELESIKKVDSVTYDTSSKYNKEGKSLYILNVKDYSKSEAAKEVYKTVVDKYDNIQMSGSIYSANKSIVELWILVSAVVFAMIILIILCDSYIEPFLFLFTIGLAIFLNNGSNIMFDNVSGITNAISAILQLALSMDYSIMLMNRYTQEKQKNKDNKEAMKNALYNAAKSITSSSVTTIVGLLTLVFMSFTIGRDLGFVLAKGVFFSLVTIFTCLPALILIFDKLIEKTKKKKMNFKLDILGNISYKFRFISLFIFLILLIGSYFLKGNLTYLFTGAEQDEISNYFKTNNQMVIVYNNKYEDIVGDYCRHLNNKDVDKALCYGNTINQKLKYNELNNKFKELEVDNETEEYLLRIIYYYYYNEDINNKMSFGEFINFLENTVYKNENISSSISPEMKSSINKLKYFVYKDEIYKNRNIKNTSNILGIDQDKIKMLYVLEHSNNVNIKMDINTFINFLNKDVITNKTYGKNIDNKSKKSINELKVFTNKNTINRNMNSNELSNLFGMDKDSVDKLLLLYYSKNGVNEKMTITEFLRGVDNSRSYLQGQDLGELNTLITISKINSSTPLNKAQLKAFFKGSDQLVEMVYQYLHLDANYILTPSSFIDIVLNNFSSYLPKESINKFNLIKLVLNDNGIKYSYNEMSSLLGVSNNTTKQLYAVILAGKGYEFRLSPYKFVRFILNNRNNELLKGKLDNSTIKKLELLNKVMYGVNTNKKYSYSELSNLLEMNKKDLSLLYSLYDISYKNKNYSININKFVNFILNNVITDSKYKDSFDSKSISKLRTIKTIIDGSLSNTKYSNKDFYNILSGLSTDLDQNKVDLIYIYSGSINNYDDNYELTIEEFVVYLNDKFIDNKIFKDFIKDDMRNDIKESKDKVLESKKLLVGKKYSRALLNTSFDKEGEKTFKYIQSIKDDLKTNDKEIYIIGDSPMAYDMNGSFGSELNFISILTAISIFIVVALTFKSLLVPLILVAIIECSVFVTMSILSFSGTGIYFIAILIVQSILMGATIDYAIVYTSYYKEFRLKGYDVKEAIIKAYNNSIHTILTSASILIIVTFIVGLFAEAIAAKICMTVSKGTICSSILILLILPGILATVDKFIIKKKDK